MMGREFIMQTRSENSGNNGFLIGLITGGVIGAGLVMAFAPDLRKRLKRSAIGLSDASAVIV